MVSADSRGRSFLLLVAAALVMSLAFPIREFIAQRAEISALENELQAHEDRVAELKAARTALGRPRLRRAAGT